MTLSGWGNYPRHECQVFRAYKPADVCAIVRQPEPSSLISRGLGRSYGDSAVNQSAGVILQTPMNRMLAFDAQAGVLECEAGVSLEEILQVFVPRGFFLPVTPGTKFVTIGGAIAADIHGKNHHVDGSFGQFVLDFQLMLADGSVITCARDQNREAFIATLGGMGLTGAILSARIKLKPIPSAYVTVDYQKATHLDEALELFASGDRDYAYSVAWIDCLAGGDSLGRSILMRANPTAAADVAGLSPDPFRAHTKRPKSVPFNMPSWSLNSWSVKAFNGLFYWKHANGRKIVDYDTFFYPLDSVLHWNRIYGKRGFVQYQPVFPPATARQGLIAVLEKLSASRRASFLAVLKTMGPAGDGLLSFPMAGHTLALDMPYTGSDLVAFLHELDEIVLKHEGRVYLAKDSVLTAETFGRMYPNADQFRRIKQQLDPAGRFSSCQSRRLGLTEGT